MPFNVLKFIESVEHRFVLFRRTTPGYQLFLLLTVITGISPVLAIKPREAAKDELHASSFYGPGVVTAWLVTSFWMIGNVECFPVLRRTVYWVLTKKKRSHILPAPVAAQETNDPTPPPDPIQLHGVDGAMASIVFYPAVAAMDSFRSRHQPGGSPAAENVCRLGMFVSWYAVWTVNNMPGSFHARYPVWPSTARLWTWHLMYTVCFVAYYTAVLSRTVSGIATIQWVTFWMMMLMHVVESWKESMVLGIALKIRHPNKATRRLPPKPLSHWLFWQLVSAFTAQLQTAERRKSGLKGYQLIFSWPRSGNRVRDLDQWTAVAAACLFAFWPHIEQALQFMRHSMWNVIVAHDDWRRARPKESRWYLPPRPQPPPPPPPPSPPPTLFSSPRPPSFSSLATQPNSPSTSTTTGAPTGVPIPQLAPPPPYEAPMSGATRQMRRNSH